jgi:tetratricopeptide (TPR) repeat protein
MFLLSRLKTLFLLSVALVLLAACGSSAREKEAEALYEKANALIARSQFDAAVPILDDIDRRFGKDNTPKVREWVVAALRTKGSILGQLDAGIAVFDEVAYRFGGDRDLGVRAQVANTLFAKVMILRGNRRYNAALAAYDDLDRRFGKDDALGVRVAIAEALHEKAWVLRIQGKDAAAIAVCNEIETRFRKDVDEIERRYGKNASGSLKKKPSGSGIGDDMYAFTLYDRVNEAKQEKCELPGRKEFEALGMWPDRGLD